MTVKYAPRTSTDAVAFAKSKVGTSYPKGWCQAWTVGVFGTGGVGDYDGDRAADAEDGWKKAKAVGKVVLAKDIKDYKDIPSGVALYWTGGSNDNGHASVSAGGGYTYTTDLPTAGKIGKVTISTIKSKWGLTFLGYVTKEGNGFTLTDRPTGAPPVAVWGKPETFVLGATGPDVVRLGERIVVHSAALGLPKPYAVGPGSPLTQIDVDRLAAIQKAWGDKDHDGYPGPLTFQRLAADPEVSSPPAKLVEVVTACINMAGNNSYGMKTGATRAKKYAAARKATPVDNIAFQECTVDSDVRPTLDTELKPLKYLRANGGKGRYNYPNTGRVEVIAKGLITTPKDTWYQADDKQAGWVVFKKDGVLAMDVSLHLESEWNAIEERDEQALFIASQSLIIGERLGVDHRNVALFGDTNSEKRVIGVLAEKGWRNMAKGTKFEDTYTFMGWDGKSRKRFDYGLVLNDALDAELEALVHDTSLADHASLRFRRVLATV